MTFTLKTPSQPTGTQPQAIKKLTKGVEAGNKHQTLLGVTGSGKTFTMANIIANTQRPTLVVAHNKTLAAQLYQEFRDFFPANAVSYFVSYYDYYQPEAYIPTTDTYIEKEADINDEIDKLRLAATTNLLTRPDTIVVASVSCIYNLGSPVEYGQYLLQLAEGEVIPRKSLLLQLANLQYEHSSTDFRRGSYRLRGDTIQIWPAYQNTALKVETLENKITKIQEIDPISGNVVIPTSQDPETQRFIIYPAKHYMMNQEAQTAGMKEIEKELEFRLKEMEKMGKTLEAYRLKQKVNYDLEMMRELRLVNGIENYSRYFDGRNPGQPPYTLLDYFAATPDEWEQQQSGQHIAEQLIRPNGLVDPLIELRPIQDQIEELVIEVIRRKSVGQRVLVTTLTKKMAEALTEYLNTPEKIDKLIASFQQKQTVEKYPETTYQRDEYINTQNMEIGKINTAFFSRIEPLKNTKQIPKPKVAYLHSDIETLDRSDILDDLRKGEYDVLVGINLLREGLDLPEVSLVAILDADKEGFLRSRTSLIQTMGRAARHISGEVILYADVITNSIIAALDEVKRRRTAQEIYNKTHGITPQSIHKPIRERLVEKEIEKREATAKELLGTDEKSLESMTPQDKKAYVGRLTKAMREASKDLNFELAAQ